MKKSDLTELIKEEIRTALKEGTPEHFLKNPLTQKLNTLMFNLYDSDKISEEEFINIQSILKSLDNQRSLKEGDQFPPKSLLGIFIETADNNALYLDEVDTMPFLKCMYAAYKMGSSNKTWK
jgi:hypothetical protein